jgi:hypothetical protein
MMMTHTDSCCWWQNEGMPHQCCLRHHVTFVILKNYNIMMELRQRRDYSSVVVMIMDDGGDDLIHLQYANMMV